MHLCEALQVRKGEVVSFVGAGGKTTAMYRLGHELAAQSWRVITTTTTMIRPPSPEQTPALLVERNPRRVLRQAREALLHKRLVTVASEQLETENKLKGIDPGLVTEFVELADAVLIEADGAKGRSVKAPAAHEPVVPSESTLLVPVVGIDAVGRRLSEETVHRPDLVAELTGLGRGQLISTSMLAGLLLHPQGALKGAPAGARVMPLINKVLDEVTLEAAREVAGSIKGNRSLARVLVGAVAADDPVIECWRRVSAVVLAAGESKRFGCPKQLLPVAGTTMLEHVLHAIRTTSLDEIVVVVGHSAGQIGRYIPSWCRMVLNEDWRAGISSSIRAGLEAVDHKAEAALFILADQPLITGAGIDRVLQAYYGHMKPVVVPVHQEQRGTPVLFDRCLFAALKSLRGDVGGRQILARFADEVLAVEMPSPEMFLDIDTPADYDRFLSTHKGADVTA